MFTYKRLIVSVVLSVILCSLFSIYTIERIAKVSAEPLTTYLHNQDSFDYSISIPTYWGKVSDSTHDIMFSGDNYEYLYMDFSEKETTYNKSTYGTFVALKLDEKYNISEPNFEELKKNGMYIYKTTFKVAENNYVAGYVDCGDFIVEFEYKRTDKNDINKNLDNIISSIQRFEVKEASLNEQTSEQ